MLDKCYILYRCDEWKSKSSFSLVGVFDYNGLVDEVKGNVLDGYFVLDGVGDIDELDGMDVYTMDNILKYGCIIETGINDVVG